MYTAPGLKTCPVPNNHPVSSGSGWLLLPGAVYSMVEVTHIVYTYNTFLVMQYFVLYHIENCKSYQIIFVNILGDKFVIFHV